MIPYIMSTKTDLCARARWNVFCLFSAFACATVNTVLIVGGSGMAIMSVGGSAQVAPWALVIYYVGAAVATIGAVV